jgi:hypothetical protein
MPGVDPDPVLEFLRLMWAVDHELAIAKLLRKAIVSNTSSVLDSWSYDYLQLSQGAHRSCQTVPGRTVMG